jgi:hypothetical protein
VPYQGLAKILRQESLGLHILLEEWDMRNFRHNKDLPRAFGTQALDRIDKMIDALTQARDQLAEELKQL